MQPDEVLKDPALEARARELSRELRCMVCQNQSIDDSDAPLARDLRLLVRERLVQGDSDRQVLRFPGGALRRVRAAAAAVALAHADCSGSSAPAALLAGIGGLLPAGAPAADGDRWNRRR